MARAMNTDKRLVALHKMADRARRNGAKAHQIASDLERKRMSRDARKARRLAVAFTKAADIFVLKAA